MDNDLMNAALEAVKETTPVEVVNMPATGNTAGSTALKIGGGFLGGIAAGIGGTKLVQWLKNKKTTEEDKPEDKDKKGKKKAKKYTAEEIEEIKNQAVAETMAELVDYTDDGDPVEEPEQ